MARNRLYNLIEYLFDERYFIFEHGKGEKACAPDSAEWFRWIASLSSFHFQGRQGHFTARQEKMRRGDSYWYAYLKAHQILHKRYLGATEKLTLAHLEKTAGTLHSAVFHDGSDDELLRDRSRNPVPNSLTVGSLTFEWDDNVLKLKTPIEQYYLNRAQAAELLSYLYNGNLPQSLLAR